MRLQEMSQRDPGGPVQLVIAQAEANLRQLLQIPDSYSVLFFQVPVRHLIRHAEALFLSEAKY